MTKTTAADVRSAFERFVNAARAAGVTRTTGYTDYDRPVFDDEGNRCGFETGTATLTADDFTLSTGSPLYGHPWALNWVGPHGAHYTHEFTEALGWSKAEAYQTLTALARGLDAATAARREAESTRAAELQKLADAVREARDNGDDDDESRAIVDLLLEIDALAQELAR